MNFDSAGYSVQTRLDFGKNLRGECRVATQVRVNPGPIAAFGHSTSDLGPEINDRHFPIHWVCCLIIGHCLFDDSNFELTKRNDHEDMRFGSGCTQSTQALGDTRLQIAFIRRGYSLIGSVIDGDDRGFLPLAAVRAEMSPGVQQRMLGVDLVPATCGFLIDSTCSTF